MVSMVTSPAPWRGEALQDRPEQWLYLLDEAEIRAVVTAAQSAVAAGVPLRELARSDYPLTGLEAAPRAVLVVERFTASKRSIGAPAP